MDAKTQAYVDKVVGEAPPLTPAQIDRIALLLQGKQPVTSIVDEEKAAARIAENERARERQAAITEAEKLAAAIMACDMCNLPPVAHAVQKQYGLFHDWVPGRAAKVMGQGK